MREQLDTIKHMHRLSGILVHPTSLPGEYGIGDLGPEAYRFVDFLRDAGQHIWQTLPLGPTGETNCPYQCYSSFAGQPLLISPELLMEDGLLTGEDLRDKPDFPEEQVDYELVKEYKDTLFRKAFAKFQMSSQERILTLKKEFDAFCLHTDWLPDYAMFMAIKKSKKGAHWLNWEKKYRKPTKSQKAVIERELYEEICYEKFLQWLFPAVDSSEGICQ